MGPLLDGPTNGRPESAAEAFRRRARQIRMASVAGFALTLPAVALAVATGLPCLFVFAFPGFAVAWGALMYARLFGFCCPACRENLGRPSLSGRRYDVWSPRSATVRSCPYCGSDLDGMTVEGRSLPE